MKKPLFLVVSASFVWLNACSSPPQSRAERTSADVRGLSSIGIVALASPAGADEDDENPGQYRVLRDQGIALYKQGDLTRAANQLETAFLVHPDSKETWPRYLLFYCHMATGEYRSAKALAEEIVKHQPYSSLAYQQVGMAQLWLGQPAPALQSFLRAIEFGAHSPRAHFFLGLAQGSLRQPAAKAKAFGDAEAEYLQILKANPNDFTANYELAALYLYWNREVESVPDLLANAKEGLKPGVEQEFPERKIYQQFYLPLLEGIYLQKKGVPKASLTALFTALANAPAGAKADIAEILHYIGRNLLDGGNVSGARGFLERGLGLDPTGPYAGDIKILLTAKRP